MRMSGLRRYTLMSCVAATVLAGCGQLVPLANTPQSVARENTDATHVEPAIYVANDLYRAASLTEYAQNSKGDVARRKHNRMRRRLVPPHAQYSRKLHGALSESELYYPQGGIAVDAKSEILVTSAGYSRAAENADQQQRGGSRFG
jgi:hypothetical protein